MNNEYILDVCYFTVPGEIQNNKIICLYKENNKLFFKAKSGKAANSIEIEENDIGKAAYDNLFKATELEENIQEQTLKDLVKLVKKYGYDLSDFDFSRYSIKRLFEAIPEINNVEGSIKRSLKVAIDGDLGCYTFYEQVFCAFIASLIKKATLTSEEKNILDRSFSLIEELANHEDEDINNLVDIGIIESLINHVDAKELEKYLLPESKRKLHMIL